MIFQQGKNDTRHKHDQWRDESRQQGGGVCAHLLNCSAGNFPAHLWYFNRRRMTPSRGETNQRGGGVVSAHLWNCSAGNWGAHPWNFNTQNKRKIAYTHTYTHAKNFAPKRFNPTQPQKQQVPDYTGTVLYWPVPVLCSLNSFSYECVRTRSAMLPFFWPLFQTSFSFYLPYIHLAL
jgi:hypothetical protein